MKIEITIEEFGSLLDSGVLSAPGLLHRLHERAGTHIRTIEQFEERLKAANDGHMPAKASADWDEIMERVIP